jgi:hypothetical protein
MTWTVEVLDATVRAELEAQSKDIRARYLRNWLSTSLRLVDSGGEMGESEQRKNTGGGRAPWRTNC